MSWLAEHRTICEVLIRISERAVKTGDWEIVELCDEAIGYAQKMSKKLQEYKQKEEAAAKAAALRD